VTVIAVKLDVLIQVLEWQHGRWVAVDGRRVAADPDQRYRSDYWWLALAKRCS
jgi:RNase P/RNase MRP subunit p29